jgi:chorismate-pyruvate lyase
MTLAMERFHGGHVSLVVVARRQCDDGRYAREILLKRPDGRVVQAGIVRIDLARFSEANAAAIRSESTPLGRILLAAGLHCDVHDVELLRLDPGPEFSAVVGSSSTAPAFGRVASIGLDGRAIIDLLEIVAPGTA